MSAIGALGALGTLAKNRRFRSQAFGLLANLGDGLPEARKKRPLASRGSQRPSQEAPVRVELTMSDLQSDALATWLRRHHRRRLISENYEIDPPGSSAGLLPSGKPGEIT